MDDPIITVAVGGPCFTNTVIITRKNSDSAVIVDPEIGIDGVKEILKRFDCDIAKSNILITHGHFDHTGDVSDLSKLGAKVYISETDYRLLESCNFDFKLNGFLDTAVKPFKADVLVNDGDTVNVSGIEFKVMLTAGHTAGSVCYISDLYRFILSGDTLFRLGVGRTDLPHGDATAMSNSIKRLFSLIGDYTVYPGHGQITTLEFERKYNYYGL